ncbi:MAG: DUF2851 family protein [Candidatus Marinimicrobia bacterium]|nr:DUF2851 family protein [Candidatus Neomarinimicrobiota bacterium]MBL7023339.1 DUF2851 family protein [Candidatus Neomarinimicrobiota bacterium]MBL7109298.1 DUF2851 family protein [Candidatus Neomarinimicrobiota bacterium]
MRLELNCICDQPLNFISDEANYYGIWQNQTGCSFVSSQGMIKVIHPGFRNNYSGPDFKQAVIQFSDGQIKRGDVEIHVNNSDWEKHHHRNNPAFQKVILHVIGKGDPMPVWLNNEKNVQTISLGNQLFSTNQPCRDFGYPDIFRSFVESESYQRWEYLQSFFCKNTLESINRIFGLVYNKETSFVQEYSNKFMAMFHNRYSEDEILKSMVQIVNNYQWIMGRRRPMNHPKYKISILTFLAIKLLKTPQFVRNYYLSNMLSDIEKLSYLGYLTPGKSFVNEILGNIIYPLKQILSSQDYFSEWFCLPAQPYGIVNRKLKLWGIKIPINFGLQQGILQIDKDYCQGCGCDYCPILHCSS